jgi:carboxypeptidase T
MNRFTISFIAMLMSSLSIAQFQYSRAKVWLLEKDIEELAYLGISVDHGTYKLGTYLICDYSDEEIALMRENGFEVDILIPDVQQFYREQATIDTKNSSCESTSYFGFQFQDPENFTLGSMAGYYTFNEYVEITDEMPLLFPNLISEKAPISDTLSHENRPIEYMRITSNVANFPNTKPKVLFTSIIHAREPGSLSETIYFMWFLLENYGVNDEITFLLDNTELFFVPMVNPDGYIHNETTDPMGGGMHRKNKNPDIGTTNPGVDLNRNFAHEWGTTGVQFNENSHVFPGTGPFSEPETQNLKKLVENNDFLFAFNAHTFSNLILHPIGYSSTVFADDHNYFAELTEHMVFFNEYLAIKSSELYPASGTSDDYMYLDEGVFAMTPEVGSSFWEPASQIIDDCRDMLFSNLILIHAAHHYSAVIPLHDSKRISASIGNWEHSVQKLGLQNGMLTVSIEPLLNIQSVGSPISYTNMDVLDQDTGAIAYELVNGLNYGDTVRYVLVSDFVDWQRRDTINLFFGDATLRLVDNAQNTNNWTGGWGLTTEYFVSTPSSFNDSPGGNYSPWDYNTYEFNTSYNLSFADAAILRFHAKWSIEPGWDFAQFQVSTDGGLEWFPMCGRYTKPGIQNADDTQPVGEPLYDGFQSTWVVEEIDLVDYLGESDVRFRFILAADGFVHYEGFYFDNFEVRYDPETVAVSTHEQIGLHLYPNPADDHIHVQLTQHFASGKLEIREISGKLLQTIPVEKGTEQLQIDIGAMANGVYLMQFKSNSGLSEVVRFVVGR